MDLQRRILGIRGGHAAKTVLASVSHMTEQEKREWLMLIDNLIADSRREGERRVTAQPWRFVR